MDDEDIPDLDDMTELVHGIKLNQQRRSGQAKRMVQQPSKDEVVEPVDINRVKNEREVPKTKKFGGMKKGFLFNNEAPKKNPLPPAKRGEDVVSPKFTTERQNNPLVLDEVQEAMKETASIDKSWITENLLKQVESNQKLSRPLADPRIAKALSWMQKDPKAAMEHYKNDQEVQTFFKEFHQILGSHFTQLGDQQQQQTRSDVSHAISSEDEKAMQDILSNPEIKEILVKPHIQRLLDLLRNHPDEAQRHLNDGDASLRADVSKLASAGVLAFQST